MSKQTLCRDGFEVAVGGHGDRLLVSVSDSGVYRFWSETAQLENALDGGTTEFSSNNASIRFVVDGAFTSVKFRSGSGQRYSCSVPTRSLVEAVAEVRGYGRPGGDEGHELDQRRMSETHDE